MSLNDELGPPPPPKPANFTPPPMPANLAKQYPQKAEQVAKAAAAAGGGGKGGAAGGQPMMMAAQNGFPMVGGMGPNLVFNFYSPGGAMMCQQPGGGGEKEKKDEGPPPPPMRVQGDPTWCQPRVTVTVGKPLKSSPCCIM